ncbi:breast carcinoma amplified sequence 2 [Seminavis robusta]|uniref:Breast carcinoma amplified sequence 2 n=1 Tax=Seminavis robusta TaxID=568900 RepID=A0A9N8EES7_9STRA|nr:breast carcinoma amplified sequence 2 [Seminavis robusta]|eukprot:Sro1048_g235230.1 breast carcinoma amplified sequence 2 (223) ;mRNA; f:17120-17788
MSESDTRSSGKKRPAPSSSETAQPVSRDALMDALPYVDSTHEDYEQYALALIEEEMKNSKPPSDVLGLAPIKFRSPLMEAEYQRYVESDGKPEPIKLPKASKTQAPTSDTLADWDESVQQARSEYERERVRSMILDVKKDSGAALLWKGFNGNLDKELEAHQKLLNDQRQRVEQINLQRSEDQQKTGKQLEILTNQYQASLERRFRLDMAIDALEHEITQLS